MPMPTNFRRRGVLVAEFAFERRGTIAICIDDERLADEDDTIALRESTEQYMRRNPMDAL